ncbi:amino acid synthesis family protein [Burkholderia arboris]|uniref:amino acid synthesis family protein n=1 Tax=Burkholderia arboris TaxID=488730 RepID=UPI001CA3B018|nr:amino acid synthesis family protein [Burkholderia arboris]MBY8605975.1 amino acid synthesis family protein [Burkholderia arboris]MCA8050274.1 amino acid synthesis family protein [Burkholderia arboris]
MSIQIAKIVVHLVERRAELGVAIDPPQRQAIAAAVLTLKGWRADDPLEPLYEVGAELGTSLTEHARCALGAQRSHIQVYGKAALVGTAVPLECAAAVLHPRMGKAVRACLPGAVSLIPSVTKRGAAGACMDIPLHGAVDMWNFDHFDTASLVVPDSPAPDELVVAVALAERGRPLARVVPE